MEQMKWQSFLLASFPHFSWSCFILSQLYFLVVLLKNTKLKLLVGCWRIWTIHGVPFCSIPCASGKKCAQISEMPSFLCGKIYWSFFSQCPASYCYRALFKGGYNFQAGDKADTLNFYLWRKSFSLDGFRFKRLHMSHPLASQRLRFPL